MIDLPHPANDASEPWIFEARECVPAHSASPGIEAGDIVCVSRDVEPRLSDIVLIHDTDGPARLRRFRWGDKPGDPLGVVVWSQRAFSRSRSRLPD